jgi:hypothetical protein
MRQVVVGSTTHIDRHNERMTLQALESMARQINSERKPILTVEHDTTLPPIGKMLRAWIEPMEDGEFKLLIEQEIFEKEEHIILVDGSQGLMRESETDNSPFVRKAKNIPETLILRADLANFASLNDYQAFLTEVKDANLTSFVSEEMGRKSFIPDPELVITIGKGLLTYFVAKKIIDTFGGKISDKLSDEVSNDIAEFYVWVKTVALKYTKYVVPKNRPMTYVFSIPITPHIELAARSSDASEITAAIMLDNLEEPLRQAQEYRDKLGAERVQFLLDEDGEWKLNYMLTDKGQVIGTKKSFSRKAQQLDLSLPPSLNSTPVSTPKLLKQTVKNSSKRPKRKRRK